MIIDLNQGQTRKQILEFNKLIEEYINTEMTQFQFLNLLQKSGISYENKFDIKNESLISFNNIIFEIFKKNDIDLFPHAGTLLGIIRDKNLIEHDDDCDWGASFYDLEKKFEILKKELKKINITIFRVGEKAYDNGYYFYKLKSNVSHKIKLGNYYFNFVVEGDIFPILYLDNPSQYSKIYELFFLSNNYSEKATHNKYIRTLIRDRSSMISKIKNDESINKYWIKLLDKNKIIWDKKLHKKFSNKFHNLYYNASIPKRNDMYIMSPGAVFQDGFKKKSIKKLKTKNGTLIYRNRSNPKGSLISLYGYWEASPEIKYIHSLSKNNIL